MIDAHRQAFKEEANELLTELESSLLELEEVPDDNELIAKVFRALHTIKGSSGMFGYDDITMFTHDIENVYDHIRKGEIAISKHIIDLTLLARDQIASMLNDTNAGVDEEKTKEILNGFRGIISDFKSKSVSETPQETETQSLPLATATQAKRAAFYISFKPDQTIFLSGTNPLLLINEIKDLGSSVVFTNFQSVPGLNEINPEYCYATWEILLVTDKGIDSIRDVFIFVEDQCELKIEIVDETCSYINETALYNFEDLLVSNVNDIQFNFESLQHDFITQLVETATTRPKEKTLVTRAKEAAETHHEPETGSSIRVKAEKLDELINLVGELVTLQARLTQIASTSTDVTIISISEEVEQITWALRDSALNIRMLPIGTTFSKFKRLVRDLSKELGKQVELTTEGAETELDKTVIERLNDPLVHIIRNSIDHGIEMPDERTKANKPITGSVKLSATQSGGSVLITIADDGAGLDKEAIRNKAISLGMISENAELTDSEIYTMIFMAGFSTAKKVTNVSGRGVGMDVVRKAIENLRGLVEVNSKKGEGTQITLKLPLTLAIIDGLLVNISQDFFVMPLSSVVECIELTQQDIDNSHGRHLVNIRGDIIPYVNLRERFMISGSRPDIEQVVIADIKGTRVGFLVDKVVGQHQTVLKTLGRVYKDIEGISGATILGDGTLALILDVLKLAEKEELEEKTIF
jgi:two-component system, chemotaxis family, sensor kinase CheA